jgi:hypothetical protein
VENPKGWMVQLLGYLINVGLTKEDNYDRQKFYPYYSNCKSSKIVDPVRVSSWHELLGSSDYDYEKALVDGPVVSFMKTCPRMMR